MANADDPDAFCRAIASDLSRFSGEPLSWPAQDDKAFAEILEALRKRKTACLDSKPWFAESYLKLLWALSWALGQSPYRGILKFDKIADLLFDQVRAALCGRRRDAETAGVKNENIPLFSSPNVDAYRQQPCTPETSSARAALIAKACSGRRARVLLVGDDDMVGLRLAGFPGLEVHVLDKDPQVLALIASEAARRSLVIGLQAFDVDDGIPPQLADRFSVASTDPPYNVKDARRFLRTAIMGLSGKPGDKVLLSVSRGLLDEGFPELTAWMGEFGFSIKTVMENFNEYPIPAIQARRLRRALGPLAGSRAIDPYLRLPSFFSDLIVFERRGE